VLVAAVIVAGAGLTGCSEGTDSGALTVGTTEKVTGIDPAGSYDMGSFTVMNQVYPFLMNTPYGASDPEPDIAASAQFTTPTEYTVTLKPGLTFANGNALTASDVKFSFDRQLAIKDPNGPSVLLSNLDRTEMVDDTTVVFHLKTADDHTFAQVLASPAGPIVDEEVFAPDALTSDSAIVAGQPFAGPYTITAFELNQQITYQANPVYKGLFASRTAKVVAKYYARSSSLKRDVQAGTVDVAYRNLSPADIVDLRADDTVKVVEAPGGEIRFLVFNTDTQPYGAAAADADLVKAGAVRQAVAHLLDREVLADYVYKGTYAPLYSHVPVGLTGATAPLYAAYGDGQGGPSLERAEQVLAEAEVTTPVSLTVHYVSDHYGPASSDEFAQVKKQLEAGGLFRIKLAPAEWVQFTDERITAEYPAYQLGWFPDYSDADNYLSAFFAPDNILANHFQDPVITDAIVAARGIADPAERAAALEQIQADLAVALPTLPYLQSVQVAATGTNVSGVERTLDASGKFRYSALALTD